MAKLNASARKQMPKSSFAGPGKSFPVNDKTHARLAISGATRSFNAGNISKSTEEHIKSEARGKLGKVKMSHGGLMKKGDGGYDHSSPYSCG